MYKFIVITIYSLFPKLTLDAKTLTFCQQRYFKRRRTHNPFNWIDSVSTLKIRTCDQKLNMETMFLKSRVPHALTLRVKWTKAFPKIIVAYSVFIEKLIVTQVVNKLKTFMKPGPPSFHKPVQSSPHIHILFLSSILRLSYQLHLGMEYSLLTSALLT
jgi:hypothetical protein